MIEYNRFEVKNENEDQDQSIPKSIGTLTVLRCIFCPNLESLTPFGIDLSPGQTHSPKWGKFWLLSSIWPWRSRSMNPKNNRDLNQGVLHFWSKFNNCSLSGWQVIVQTNWWLTDTHTYTHTHTQTQATTIPEGHNWPRVKMICCFKTYIIAYVKTKQKIRFFIHYIKPTAQLLFKIRFPKGGPTCRMQVVNPRHQTPQGQSVAKPETPLQNIQVE